MFCEEFWTDYILWQFYVQLFCESHFIWPNTQKPFCAITNLLCIAYLLPPANVVLRKGNVLIISIYLFTGGPHVTTTHYAIGQSQSPSYHHHTDTCHLPPHFHMGTPPPSLIIWTLGTPTTWKRPPPTHPHTHLYGKQAVGLQLHGFLFSVFQSNF